MALQDINKLWGSKWIFKDKPSLPLNFHLINNISGVKIATIKRGENIKDIYQSNSSSQNVCFEARNNGYIWIGSGIASQSQVLSPNELWEVSNGGTPVIIEFIVNEEDFVLECYNITNFLNWWNENATEYVPSLEEWAEGVSNSIRKKTGRSKKIKPAYWEKEIDSIISGSKYEIYSGDYNVIPNHLKKTLYTKDKVLIENVVVSEIPFDSVENESGGNTVTIGETLVDYNGETILINI